MRTKAGFLVGVLVGVAVGGGVGVIAAASTKTVTVCANKTTGMLRYAKDGKCVTKNETKVVLNQTGATGATGATGTTGTNGTNGTIATVAITQQAVCDGTDVDTVADELCKIGMTGPGGGHIFFVDYNDQYPGLDYLEAAPVECESERMWSPQETLAVTAARGWAASAVGQGQANTTAILAVYTSDTTLTNAAKYANSLDCGTKTDWFLGSIGEMSLMYTNLRQSGVGSFSTGNYWSSTEKGDSQAWNQVFNYGFVGDGDYKYNGNYVRPVRAF